MEGADALWRVPDSLQRERQTGGEIRVKLDGPDPTADLKGGISAVFSQTCLWAPRNVIVLCIGSDRFIGDALGPLVGTLLLEQRRSTYSVRGDLSNTVHACNLHEVIRELEERHQHAFVLAVDASLGRPDSVGTLCVAPGGLHPGAGVNKSLPAVGHMHITGVVNVGGFMEYFVLQNTRLGFVMRMARLLADGIDQTLQGMASQRA